MLDTVLQDIGSFDETCSFERSEGGDEDFHNQHQFHLMEIQERTNCHLGNDGDFMKSSHAFDGGGNFDIRSSLEKSGNLFSENNFFSHDNSVVSNVNAEDCNIYRSNSILCESDTTNGSYFFNGARIDHDNEVSDFDRNDAVSIKYDVVEKENRDCNSSIDSCNQYRPSGEWQTMKSYEEHKSSKWNNRDINGLRSELYTGKCERCASTECNERKPQNMLSGEQDECRYTINTTGEMGDHSCFVNGINVFSNNSSTATKVLRHTQFHCIDTVSTDSTTSDVNQQHIIYYSQQLLHPSRSDRNYFVNDKQFDVRANSDERAEENVPLLIELYPNYDVMDISTIGSFLDRPSALENKAHLLVNSNNVCNEGFKQNVANRCNFNSNQWPLYSESSASSQELIFQIPPTSGSNNSFWLPAEPTTETLPFSLTPPIGIDDTSQREETRILSDTEYRSSLIPVFREHCTTNQYGLTNHCLSEVITPTSISQKKRVPWYSKLVCTEQRQCLSECDCAAARDNDPWTHDGRYLKTDIGHIPDYNISCSSKSHCMIPNKESITNNHNVIAWENNSAITDKHTMMSQHNFYGVNNLMSSLKDSGEMLGGLREIRDVQSKIGKMQELCEESIRINANQEAMSYSDSAKRHREIGSIQQIDMPDVNHKSFGRCNSINTPDLRSLDVSAGQFTKCAEVEQLSGYPGDMRDVEYAECRNVGGQVGQFSTIKTQHWWTNNHDKLSVTHK